MLSGEGGAQPEVRVVLDGLGDGALGLAQRALGRPGSVGQRPSQRSDHEGVGILAERERGPLARGADDPARRAREPAQVVVLAARGAGRELRRQARGEEQLEAERELVGVARARGGSLQEPQLVEQQVEDLRVGLGRLEEPADGVAGARGGVERGRVLAQAGVRPDRVGGP